MEYLFMTRYVLSKILTNTRNNSPVMARYHYNDAIMSAMASQFTSLTVVYSTVYSRRRTKEHQSCASLAFVRGIHRWPVNFPHKGPVTLKMFPFDDVIMWSSRPDTHPALFSVMLYVRACYTRPLYKDATRYKLYRCLQTTHFWS